MMMAFGSHDERLGAPARGAISANAAMNAALDEPVLRAEGLTRVFRDVNAERDDDGVDLRPLWKRILRLGRSDGDEGDADDYEEFGGGRLADRPHKSLTGAGAPGSARGRATEGRKTESLGLLTNPNAELRAVDNVTFALHPGRLVAVFGRSGSGKTTLLNLLCGLDRPTSGAVYFDGRDMTNASARAWAGLRRRRIGFVFQRFLLHGRRSALENTLLPLLLAGHTPAEAREMATDALFAVGLGNRLETKASQLSGGQCQRIAIARAIAGRPSLILADEPTGNLDAVTACDILELLLQLRDERRLTLLITTHDDLIREVADEIRVMDDGRLTLEKE